MNPSDAIEAIEKPLSSLPYPISRHILEHLRKLTRHEPVPGIMGKSGAGKSSLCNALFQGEVTPVSALMTVLPGHAAIHLMTRLQTNCARSLSALRPVNSLPVRWTGYLTRRRVSALPLLHARFCAPSVTRWSLLPARYGTGFSSEPGGDVPRCCYRFLTP